MPPFHHSKRTAIISLYLYIKRSFFTPNFIKIYLKMLEKCLKIFSGIHYSKRAGKILCVYIKMTTFWNYFKKHLIKIYTNTHQIAPFFKIFSEDLLNPVMYSHLLLFEKNTIPKSPLFPIFKRSSSIHKNNPALVASIVLKKIYFHSICALSKKTFNFTRSCAFAQKAKFYSLKMFLKKISRILKLPSWQH